MITEAWVAQQFPELTSVVAYPQGGQKWVFGASHGVDGSVVIKLIKPSTDMERVRREVLAVNQVQSQRIPQIFACGVLAGSVVADDIVWLREQRVDGQNGRQLLSRGPLARADVLQLGLDVLEALADIEKARIVHRDVKPDNIMRGNDGRYWLLDLGIARHLDLSSLTATAALGGPGTPGYAPPEQYRNKKQDVDGRTDLFALAVTLVEAISGRHPYRDGARDVSEVIRRIEGAPLSVPKIPWDRENRLFDLITCMGQRRVDCRPPNAADAHVWMKEVYAAFTSQGS